MQKSDGNGIRARTKKWLSTCLEPMVTLSQNGYGNYIRPSPCWYRKITFFEKIYNIPGVPWWRPQKLWHHAHGKRKHFSNETWNENANSKNIFFDPKNENVIQKTFFGTSVEKWKWKRWTENANSKNIFLTRRMRMQFMESKNIFWNEQWKWKRWTFNWS